MDVYRAESLAITLLSFDSRVCSDIMIGNRPMNLADSQTGGDLFLGPVVMSVIHGQFQIEYCSCQFTQDQLQVVNRTQTTLEA